MKKFDYKNGIVYTQIKVGGHTIDVMRVDASQNKPYVIGSSYGGPIGKPPYAPRTAHSIEYLNGSLNGPGKVLNNKSKVFPIGSSKKTKNLRLLWMSNGTFFGGSDEREGGHLRIQGPVVMDGSVISDISPYLVPDVRKRSRWYNAQAIQRPYYGQAVNGLTAAQLRAQGNWPSIIGGGAPLIDNGSIVQKDFWLKNLAFDGGQPGYNRFGRPSPKEVGPIIASNKRGDVTYLIFASKNFFFSWDSIASYLHDPSKFLNDVKQPKDGSIHNAVAYDGGGSPQLWIRNYGILYHNEFYSTKPRKPRAVPHRICLWGL